MQWHDGSTNWLPLIDVKASYPVELCTNEPAFAWWVPHVLKKREHIISKVKTKYWIRTHKFGIKIPKSAKEAIEFDKENNNTLWHHERNG
jgi:hypothetical protein